MYLQLGRDYVVNTRDIVGIFDLENTSTSRRTRDFLAYAQKNGAVVSLSEELPKSFILTDWPSETTVYTSPVSSVTLGARARRGIRRKRR